MHHQWNDGINSFLKNNNSKVNGRLILVLSYTKFKYTRCRLILAKYLSGRYYKKFVSYD